MAIRPVILIIEIWVDVIFTGKYLNDNPMQVKAWIEKLTIPTYETGEAEKNPMFLEKRVYQGSSGVVYPHPVIETISDKKVDKEYTAIYLENEYLQIIVLPEIGGRIQRAFDKTQQRDFVYYNHVIKPALVGLAGPWISGGIEFNWPQHHRPSTFNAVDYDIEHNADGSKTVWMNETELMFRTKGAAGFTLYPGRAYLEIKGRVFNRTPFPQTFLWWANPAVKANEHYQSIFPPDVYAVFDHGKRDVSDFPIATGTYYKVNYAPGTDISRYHNIPVPTSYMAIKSKYDFMGCYEHDTQAGMLHVADHHVSPGKKQWTWGNGDFGRAWDRNLTDTDGPYIELMTGVFTDNQPDFSWLQPNEIKTFEQYFMPYARVGAVKNANREALANIFHHGNKMFIKVYATSMYKQAKTKLLHNNLPVAEFIADLSPKHILDEIYEHHSDITDTEWKIIVEDQHGRVLVSYQPEPRRMTRIPQAAEPAKMPAELGSVEELFLNGLHLEQYRHATFNPVDYYEEGLRRDASDIRCNNALGLLLLRRGQFARSEPYFRKAIETLTKRNPNPYEGEPYYNLGCSLKFQGRHDEAYDAFYKATWNDAWQHSAFLALAQIAASKKDRSNALAFVEKSLIRNYHGNTARHLKTVLLRLEGRSADMQSFAKESLAIDSFNFGCLFEQYLDQLAADRQMAGTVLKKMQTLMRDDLNNYLELSLDYAQAGFFEEALQLLNIYGENKVDLSPMIFYYRGWFATRLLMPAEAERFYKLGAMKKADYCFPNKIEEILILQDALSSNPADSKAAYYLGNLWYDKRQYREAIACWEQSRKNEEGFADVHRNLSLAYYNKLGKKDEALECMQKAFSLDRNNARLLMELDQLLKISGRSFRERLELLEGSMHLVEKRDDLWLERITLYNNTGNYKRAQELLAVRNFHPWEGGEGKVVSQYWLCYIELAKLAILEERCYDALNLLDALDRFPANLGEGKLYGAQENDLHYLTGVAYEGLHLTEKAKQKYEQATQGISEPIQAIYYNDPQPDKMMFQAMAWHKLGNKEKGDEIFKKFIRFGEEHMNDKVRIDYFAVSLPDMLVFDIDIDQRNRIHCTYLIGLGHLGLASLTTAAQYLQQVKKMDINHQGAAVYLKMFPFFKAENLA